MITLSMRFIPIVLLCGGLLLVQCKSNLAQTKKSYDSLVTAKVGKPYEEELSPSKKYALVEASDTGALADHYRYAVIQLNGNEVVLEGKFNRGGYARWINDTMIEVLTIPRHITNVPDSSLYKKQILLEGTR